ncbi:MAG: GGDEF domain-containing protein [Pyrinomonadaceae bacterium]|nr:GGDEF domain-containing protein [Pyrinomonadaceae bacterium]
MKYPKTSYTIFSKDSLWLIFLPVIFSAIIFFITFQEFNLGLKIFAYVILLALFIVTNIFCFNRFLGKSVTNSENNNESVTNEIDEKLVLLEEASEYFSSSLNSKDLFNLLCLKISEIIPYQVAVLFLFDDDTKELKIAHKHEEVKNSASVFQFSSISLPKSVFFDKSASIDNKVGLNDMLQTAIAVPLFNKTEVYGVLALFNQENYNSDHLSLIESVGNRISSSFQNSYNLERNMATALTDSLTGFPNERALYLVLEQQIAEAQRFQELRPLTVLSIDVSNFNDINSNYGHSVGDQVLVWTSKLIKNQLRQMDFLARLMGDEFLAILPTANKETTQKIIKRITNTIDNNPYSHTNSVKIAIKLHFGEATFQPNKDTAQSLIKASLEKKEINKMPKDSSVIRFPTKSA